MAIAEREIAPSLLERFYTEEEYLAGEEMAEEKSEYVQGRIRPMSGGTDYHGAIAMNLGSALIVALSESDCLIMSSDVKVHASGQMYYPDISVTCGPREYYGKSRTVITNPILVAEVLSPSTEQKDRGEKFHNYIGLDTLGIYLLVSQDRPLIEQYTRTENGHWDYVAVFGLDKSLNIPVLSISLALSDIYKRIEFAQEPGNELIY